MSKLALDRKRKNLQSQITSLQAEFEAEEAESLKLIRIEEIRMAKIIKDQKDMALSRKSNSNNKPKKK